MNKNKMVLMSLVVSMIPGTLMAGGGPVVDPNSLFTGLEATQGAYGGNSLIPTQQDAQPVPFSNPLQPPSQWGQSNQSWSWGQGGQGWGNQGWGGMWHHERRERGQPMPWGRLHHGDRDRGQNHSLLSPELAAYWYRLDANGRLQLVTYLQQWMGSLTAEQQQTLLQWVQYGWQRFPNFQQQFLSAVYTPVATASAPATPTTTAVTTATTPAVDPSTGYQIDPKTGYPIDPTTGYLIDPSTGQRIDPTTGYRIDATTGYRIDPTTGQLIDPTTGQLIPSSAASSTTTTTTAASPSVTTTSTSSTVTTTP